MYFNSKYRVHFSKFGSVKYYGTDSKDNKYISAFQKWGNVPKFVCRLILIETLEETNTAFPSN